PDVVKDETVDWDKDHGTRVEIELLAAYRGGRTGVQEYLEQTVVANPHLALTYVSPKGERFEFPRVSHELPREAQEIKPHPHGGGRGRSSLPPPASSSGCCPRCSRTRRARPSSRCSSTTSRACRRRSPSRCA